MMAANTFAMESIAGLTVGLAERGNYDIRLEAAIAKMYNTEHGWRIVDDALQIRGGRGYETADSLRARGEQPIPIERAMRDARINLIFEGSSEIMRLFIAREAVDHHFKTAFALVDKEASRSDKTAAFGRVMRFYPTWYPARWVGKGQMPGSFGEFGKLARHTCASPSGTRASSGARSSTRWCSLGPKLERRQLVSVPRRRHRRRVVRDGGELRRARECWRSRGIERPTTLADLFCRAARVRIEQLFDSFYGDYDGEMYRVAQQVMRGEHAWLETGIISLLDEHAPAKGAPCRVERRVRLDRRWRSERRARPVWYSLATSEKRSRGIRGACGVTRSATRGEIEYWFTLRRYLLAPTLGTPMWSIPSVGPEKEALFVKTGLTRAQCGIPRVSVNSAGSAAPLF